MLQLFSIYKQIFILMLALVLNIPCSVKKELKQRFAIETQQNVKSISITQSCASFCNLQLRSKKNGVDSHAFEPSTFRLSFANSPIPAKIGVPSMEPYRNYKEKIPTHIRNRQLLI